MDIKTLLEKASKSAETLKELQIFAVKMKEFELVEECRRLEKELFPITEEETQALERHEQIELVLRMVEVGFTDKKVYYKIDKALELYRKKKGKFDVADAAKIITDANRIFKHRSFE
jgi:hypothetical protein